MSNHVCRQDDLHPYECSKQCIHCNNEHDPTECCLCWDAQDLERERPGPIATVAARMVYNEVVRISLLRQALHSAIDWMAEDGCDCGGGDDEMECALCLCRAALKDLTTEAR